MFCSVNIWKASAKWQWLWWNRLNWKFIRCSEYFGAYICRESFLKVFWIFSLHCPIRTRWMRGIGPWMSTTKLQLICFIKLSFRSLFLSEWELSGLQAKRQSTSKGFLKFSNTRLKQNWPYPNRSKFLTNRLPKNLECIFSERNSSLILNFSNIPRLSLRAMTAGQTEKWNWNNRARKLPCVFGLLAPHLKPAGKVKYNFFRGWCQSLL